MKLQCETFEDKAVEELAYIKAKCLISLRKKYCSDRSCTTCRTFHTLNKVYNTFSDYDKLRIDSKANDIVSNYCYKQKYIFKEWIMNNVRTITSMLVIFFLLLLFTCNTAHADSYADSKSKTLDTQAKAFMCASFVVQFIEDINSDDVIDNIDAIYTYLFAWEYYGYDMNNIQVLGNTKLDNMFVRIRATKYHDWIYKDPTPLCDVGVNSFMLPCIEMLYVNQAWSPMFDYEIKHSEVKALRYVQ